jgi:hypothetical protein
VKELIHAEVAETNHIPVLLGSGEDAVTEPCLLPLLE